MKICIDGLSISKLNGTGLYSYTHNIITNLLKMYPQAKYDLIWDNDTDIDNWNKYKNITCVKLDIDRIKNDYSILEDYLSSSKPDLYHSPNNGLSIPKNKICKYIITAHDLSPVSCRELVDIKYFNKFSSLFPNSIDKSDCIIAVSNFIKEELIKYYRIPDKKIEVIYPWCSNIFKPINNDTVKKALSDRYGITGKFILYSGSIHERKNLNVLIKSFKLLLKQINDVTLVIVGNYSGKRREYYLLLKKLIKENDIENKVIFTGIVPYDDMPYFYNGAECTVNLSSYDGFPTTGIEAIACNSHLICAENPSFREVIGTNAVYLDSFDINTVKNSVLNAINIKQNQSCSNITLQPFNFEYKLEQSINKLVKVYESTVYD